MRIVVFMYLFFLLISYGGSTGEEYFFTVSDLPQAKVNSKLLVNKSTMYYLSSSRKDMNNICFNIKINDSNLKEQIKNSSFRLLHNGNRFNICRFFHLRFLRKEQFIFALIVIKWKGLNSTQLLILWNKFLQQKKLESQEILLKKLSDIST